MFGVLLLYVLVECFSGIELVIVKVEQGFLAGEEVVSIMNETYNSFKAIPYAASPVGELRFKAPQPPSSWEGVRAATQDAPVCPQVVAPTFHVYLPGDEDCLFLNVYSPNMTPESPLPVMFFIHGGAFKSGSGNVDSYGPDFLLSHGVVVVTINYRLEMLGFLCLDDVNVPGNAGLKDQVAALKWVKKNIHVFGGDPDNITIFGQSAGGASVALHVLSPMSKGLFKRAISMSGVPYCDWSLTYQARRRAFIVGKMLGIETTDSNELLEYLQSLPVKSLVNVTATVLASEEITVTGLKGLFFTPVIEKDLGLEHFLTEDPKELLKNKSINEVDMLIGHTNEEMLMVVEAFERSYIQLYNRYPEMVVPRKILLTSPADTILEVADLVHQHYFGNNSISNNTMREFVTYNNDDAFLYQIMRFLRDLPRVGNEKRFVYILSFFTDRNVFEKAGEKYNIFGMAHTEDLLYLFNPKAFNINLDVNSIEYNLIQLICTVFTNFAKYGNPTPNDSLGAIWPEYDCQNKYYANISNSIEINTCPNCAAVEFWKSIYDYAGLEF